MAHRGPGVTPEEITSVVQEAEAFAQAHPSEPMAWHEWAVQASPEKREAFRRVWDNTPTVDTASHSAPQRILFEHLDPLIPTMAGLSLALRSMVGSALRIWDDAG
jgi:hypothetical protein